MPIQCLGITQVLRASAGKSTWGRASTPQVGLYHVQGDGVGTQSLKPISGHAQQFEICFPSNCQDVAAGWAASLVNTRFPFIQLGRLEQCE